jgi:hypothetical protein
MDPIAENRFATVYRIGALCLVVMSAASFFSIFEDDERRKRKRKKRTMEIQKKTKENFLQMSWPMLLTAQTTTTKGKAKEKDSTSKKAAVPIVYNDKPTEETPRDVQQPQHKVGLIIP